MLSILSKLLGLIGGESITNKVAGGINFLALAPLGVWLYAHKATEICFSYEQIGIVALIIFGYVEMNRRAP